MGEESNSVRRVKEGDSLRDSSASRTLEMISYRRVKHRFVARTSVGTSLMRTKVLTTNLIIILDADMILFASKISAKLLHNSI